MLVGGQFAGGEIADTLKEGATVFLLPKMGDAQIIQGMIMSLLAMMLSTLQLSCRCSQF